MVYWLKGRPRPFCKRRTGKGSFGWFIWNRRSRSSCPVLSSLTPREQEIAALAARRLSNREIAEKLHLSEGSVKQYISQIYSKLAIEGDTRLKRQRLAELVNT